MWVGWHGLRYCINKSLVGWMRIQQLTLYRHSLSLRHLCRKSNVISTGSTLWVRFRLRLGVLDTTLCIKFVNDLQQVSGFFPLYSGFLHQKNWLPRYNWNIVESGIEHHNPIHICSCPKPVPWILNIICCCPPFCVMWFKVRGNCWYWWNCSPSLFNLSFHNLRYLCR